MLVLRDAPREVATEISRAEVFKLARPEDFALKDHCEGGGLEHFACFHLLGIIIQTEYHSFFICFPTSWESSSKLTIFFSGG